MTLIRKKKKKKLSFLPRLKILVMFPSFLNMSCGFCQDEDADLLVRYCM